MKTEKNVGDAIDIEWVDSMNRQGWESPNDLIEDGYEVCITRGWLVKETDSCLCVSATKGITPSSDYLGITIIPKCSIRKFE